MATPASCSSSPPLAPTRASSPRQRLTEHRLAQQLLLDFQHHSASKGHSGPQSSLSEVKADISDEGTVVDELDNASMTNSTSSLLCLPKHHHQQQQQLASLTNTLLAGGVALVSPSADREYNHASLESIQELKEESKLRSPKLQGAGSSWTLHANQSICPIDQGNDAQHHNRASHRHSRSQQGHIQSFSQGQLQRQRPSTSSGASTLSSRRNRVIFAPTVRIGSRPVPSASSQTSQAEEDPTPQPVSTPSQKEQFDAAAAAFSRNGTRRSTRLRISRRPETAPQERDDALDGVRRARMSRRLLSPVSWKSFASSSPKQPPTSQHTAAGEKSLVGFPDGFVSAPLHPAGPSGGDLPSNTPAISPASPGDLPPPPRPFVPGTLILARDESLWTDLPRRDDEGDRETNSESSIHIPLSLSGELTRRQTLPIEAALPSEPSSPGPGSNDNSEESPASLRLLDSRLDEVVSRGQAQTSAPHQVLPSTDQMPRTPGSHLPQIQEPVVLWHGEAPSDPPRMQKRQIPFRAIAIAARAMKRFFHSSKPSENSESVDVVTSETISKHRRRQSVMDEVLHGRRATEDEEEEAEIEQWAIQQCEIVEPSVRSPPPTGGLSEPVSLAPPDDGSTVRRSSAPDLGHGSPNDITPVRRASEPTTKATSPTTTPVRIVVSPRIPHASTPISPLFRDGSLTPSWRPGRLTPSRLKRPSTTPDTEGWSSMAHLPPTPASILVVGPSDIETRATPWEFGTPNVATPAHEIEEPQMSQDHELYITAATQGEPEGRSSLHIPQTLPTASKQVDLIHVPADTELEGEDPDKITILKE